MSVGEYCNREVTIALRQESVLVAAERMRHHHVGDLVVVESDERPIPVGILTDRDLVIEVMAAGIAPESLTIGDVMSSDPLVASEEDGLWDTLERMRGRGVRRVPVVRADGQLAGIITLDDVLEFVAEELATLAVIGRRELEREQARRK